MRKRALVVVLFLFGIVLFAGAVGIVKFYPVLFQLLFSPDIELKKADHSINILLLGIAGGTHDGADLTDTMMFVSIDPDKNKIILVSIPRDIYIPELKAKINTAYAKGNNRAKGGGLTLSKAVVSKVVGSPIDYVFAIDFAGFVKAVDLIGGLEIDVRRSFDDYEYPIEDKREDLCGLTVDEATARIATESALVVFPCRYEYVHFDKGLQHMDGTRSLIFVRSRYAIGGEGTDFARSQRQQKVLYAFKEKIFSLGTILNPIKLTSLYLILAESIDTDIKQSEFDDFIKLVQKIKNAKISSSVIELEDKEQKKAGLLINPPLTDFNGAWVLIPRVGNGNFLEIQEHVSCLKATDSCPIKSL